MPKDQYGDRDRYASDALRNVLPKHWKLKPPRDADSGSEVCQDWIVEILNDDREWTGAEFSIQNKTNPNIYDDYASTKVSVDCVLYLVDKVTRPILIHAYDIETNNSYWTWLSDWGRLSERRKWQNQKEVNVEIPISNLLTKDSLKEIEVRVYEEHRKATIRRQYDLENKLNSDFSFSPPVFKGKNIYSVAEPKHNNASFIINMDEENHKIFRQSIDYGEAKTIKASSANFPLPQSDGNEELQLTVIPYSYSHQPPIEVEFVDKEGHVIFKQYFQLKNIQRGTMLQRWRSKPINKPIFFNLDVDIASQQISFNLELDKSIKEPKSIIWYINLTKKLKSTSLVRIKNLETDNVQEAYFDGEIHFDVGMDEKLIEFIYQLAYISEELEIVFEIPDNIPYMEMKCCQIVYDILNQGYTSDVNFLPKIERNEPDANLHLTVEIPVTYVKKSIEAISTEGIAYIPTQFVSLKIDLLGQSIELEEGEGFTGCNSIVNLETFQENLDVTEDSEILETVFSVIENKCLILYRNRLTTE